MPSSDALCIDLHCFPIDPVPTNRKTSVFTSHPYSSHPYSELKLKVSLTVLDI